MLVINWEFIDNALLILIPLSFLCGRRLSHKIVKKNPTLLKFLAYPILKN